MNHLQTCALKSRRATTLAAEVLLTEFADRLSDSRGTTVDLLVQMGAIEARRLYLPLACSSMYAYCTTLMHMSENTAYKRIRTARVARKFPAILPMIAEGKLHLAAVVLLAPYLTHGNVTALLADATYKSKAEVQLLLAHRFPKPDVATVVRPLPEPAAGVFSAAQVVANITQQLSPGTVVPTDASEMANLMGPLVPNAESLGLLEVVTQGAVRDEDHVLYPPERRASVTPRSPGRFAWQLTADQEMQDLLDQARDLLGRDVPGGDLTTVLKRGLQVLVASLRKSKYAESTHPRPQSGSANGRDVPAAIVRAVSKRDGYQCVYTSEAGRRCDARSDLELDHRIPFARGGETTIANLRLLCRPHNLHEAERSYGTEHMRAQQATSRARAVQAKTAQAEARARATASSKQATTIHDATGRQSGSP